jgi:nucleoid-associated protein YgaU
VHRPAKARGTGIDLIADGDDDDDFAARGRSKSRERDIDDGLDRASDIRSNANSNRDADLPLHKVRPRETLRSIARDRLGDSRRAKEILQLNRGLIDDPSSLVAGQVIELPEDAKPGRR